MRNVAAFGALLVAGVAACAGGGVSRAPASGPSACQTSPGDDACDLCTAAKCCPQESACMADPACKAADDTLDDCEAKAEKLGRGLPECYDTFGAAGTLAKKRAECIRSNCSPACLEASTAR